MVKKYTPVFSKAWEFFFSIYFERTSLFELKMVDKFILYSSND